MLLTRRLRAGILLYALFMAAVFALFLQFYVGRLKASHQVRQALYHQTQASLMAEMTKLQAEDNHGSYKFEQGISTYHRKSDQLVVAIQLHTGQTYRYDFLVQLKTEDKNKKGEADKEHKKEKGLAKEEVVSSAKGELSLTNSDKQPEQEPELEKSSAQSGTDVTDLSVGNNQP